MSRTALPVAIALAWGICATAPAAIIHVSPGQSIQTAINGASDGDEIIVAPGTYNEAIDLLGKEIILRSSGGAESTIIDAQGENTSVVTCDSGETNQTLIDGFTLTGGTGTSNPGGVQGGGMYNSASDPTVRNCIFIDDSADDEGGGMYNFAANPIVSNCVFTQCSSTYGAGIYNTFSTPAFRNCTITNNFTEELTGGGVYNHTGAVPLLVNCIVWNNGFMSFGGSGGMVVRYSNTDDASLAGIQGNISSVPGFRDPVNNLRLLSSSPCIDAGDSTAVASTIFVDLDGEMRGVDDPDVEDTGIPVFGLVVDMGAYEVQDPCEPGGGNDCPEDLTGDERVNIFDLLELISAWGNCP
jgi:hypothetical protein